ncbi:hypothetical protein IFM89_002634 [Coptis chinensis]|uniref:Uncharacterized protein n=1 Tax=Coptis chinensis TaxID=261450 RepID=A0A835L9V5_9MAGN|nr:hypothetical protein IFM89_002634 [Coptis chinensis]
MRQLIRRLSRVADSSSSSTNYTLLRSNSVRTTRRSKASGGSVPEGHVPVYVGEEEIKERFVVSAELLNHPIFIELLKKSAQEYGYEQQGVLRIPCRVVVFKQVLDALQFGVRDLDVLKQHFSSDVWV